MSCSGFLTGNSWRSTSSISVKIAVFTPVPRAIDVSATSVKMGERASPRQPYRKSRARCMPYPLTEERRRWLTPNFIAE